MHSTLDSTRDFVKLDLTVYCYGKKHKPKPLYKKKNRNRKDNCESLKLDIIETYRNLQKESMYSFLDTHQGIRVYVCAKYSCQRKLDDKSEEHSSSTVNSAATAVSPAADHVFGEALKHDRSSNKLEYFPYKRGSRLK